MMPRPIRSDRAFGSILDPLNDNRGGSIHLSDVDYFRIHLLRCEECRQRLNRL